MATTVDGTSHWSVGPEALGPAAGKFRTTLKDQAAVVAAKVGDVAVIGPTGEEIPIAMTNGEVRNYPNNQGHKAAHEALQYLRDHRGENGAGVPLLRAMDVTQAHLGRGLSIPVMHRTPNAKGDEGMYYWFDTQVFRHVDWKAMLANLPISTINEMLGQNHVCRIGLEWVPGAYDRKRRNAAMKCKGWTLFATDVPVPVWDWHLLLSDGSVWRFHTDWKRHLCEIKLVKPDDKLPPVPRNGINQSDGHGSYNTYKYGNYESSVKVVAVDAESAVAEAEPPPEGGADAESAVAEASCSPEVVAKAGTAAASSNALGSPTVGEIMRNHSLSRTVARRLVQGRDRAAEELQNHVAAFRLEHSEATS